MCIYIYIHNYLIISSYFIHRISGASETPALRDSPIGDQNAQRELNEHKNMPTMKENHNIWYVVTVLHIYYIVICYYLCTCYMYIYIYLFIHVVIIYIYVCLFVIYIFVCYIYILVIYIYICVLYMHIHVHMFCNVCTSGQNFHGIAGQSSILPFVVPTSSDTSTRLAWLTIVDNG